MAELEFLDSEVFIRVDLLAIEDDDPEADDVGVRTMLTFTTGFDIEEVADILESVAVGLRKGDSG